MSLSWMRRSIAAAASILFTALPAAADPAAAPATAPAAEIVEVNTPAIWSIAKPGGGTITMFGSVHLLPTEKQWRTPEFEAALAGADVIVLELDQAEMQKPEIMTYLQTNAINPPGVTLTSLLTPDERKAVEAGAKAIGAALVQLDSFRPWFAALQMTVAFLMQQGMNPNAGVDQIVAAEGKAAGKAFAYFETAREQLDLFIKLPQQDQIAFLVQGAKDMVERPDEMKTMLAAWAKGDVATIDTIMNRALSLNPAMSKALLEDRNRNWANKIESEFMKDGKNYLIVGGAGHFAGPLSVQAMLRARGIEVSGP